MTWAAHRLRRLSASASARRRRSSSSATRAVRSATARPSSLVPVAPLGSGRLPPLPLAPRPCSLMGGELGIDDVVVSALPLPLPPPLLRAARRSALPGLLALTRHAEALEELLKLGGHGAQPVGRRVVLERLTGLSDQVVGARTLMHRDRVAALGQQVLGLVRGGVKGVAGVGEL